MSDPRQKPSGAQFRKRAREKEQLAVQTAASMKKWLNESSDTVDPQQETESENQEIPDDSSESSRSSSVSSTYSEKEISTDSEGILQSSELSMDYSDPSTWPAANEIDDKTRCFLTEMVAMQAEKHPNCIDFRSTEKQNRHLTSSMWYKQLPNGETIKRNWLIYSEIENALFCAPCKLFLDAASTAGTLCTLQTTGLTDWRNAAEKLLQHESSPAHKVCVVKWKTLIRTIKSCSGVSKALETSIQAEKQKWTQIIHIVIDAVLFLATNCLPFQGSLENPDTLAKTCASKTQGNFLSLIALLAKDNPGLKDASDNLRKGQVSFLSSTTQNEIIELVAQKVREKILRDIMSAKYFAIMFDCTPDISQCEQMSLILRFVKVDDGGKCEIKESFIDFIEFYGKTGDDIARQILNKLDSDGLNINNCRGQSYDNNSNMAGIYKNVQARIQEKNELAVFVPGVAHSLNLIGVHASSVCPEASHLFGIVQRVFCFFVSSTILWEIMKKYTSSTLKGTSQTRWSAKLEAVSALKKNLGKVAQALEEIKDGDFPPETKSDAESLLNSVTDFRFILNLVIWNDILREINRVNVEIQRSDIILNRSVSLMEGLITTVQRMRSSGFEGWFEDATNIANTVSVEPALPERRRSKKKKVAGELASDESCTFSAEERFKHEVNMIFDRILTELHTRLENTKKLNTDFSFLGGERLMKMSSTDLMVAAEHLAKKYSKDLDTEEFKCELETFRDQTHNFCQNTEQLSCLDLLSMIYTNHLQDAFPNLCIALRMYATLPTTSASCERCFSKMELIKTYLRSPVYRERLSNLAILSIESDVANTIDYDDAVESFAEKKARQVHF